MSRAFVIDQIDAFATSALDDRAIVRVRAVLKKYGARIGRIFPHRSTDTAEELYDRWRALCDVSAINEEEFDNALSQAILSKRSLDVHRVLLDARVLGSTLTFDANVNASQCRFSGCFIEANTSLFTECYFSGCDVQGHALLDACSFGKEATTDFTSRVEAVETIFSKCSFNRLAADQCVFKGVSRGHIVKVTNCSFDRAESNFSNFNADASVFVKSSILTRGFELNACRGDVTLGGNSGILRASDFTSLTLKTNAMDAKGMLQVSLEGCEIGSLILDGPVAVDLKSCTIHALKSPIFATIKATEGTNTPPGYRRMGDSLLPIS